MYAYQAPSTDYLVDDHDSGTARLMFVQSTRVVYININVREAEGVVVRGRILCSSAVSRNKLVNKQTL